MINVAFTIDNSYVPHCASCISSIIQHHVSQEQLVFYVVTDKITWIEKIKLILFARKENVTIHITEIGSDYFKNAYLPVDGHFKNINYYRLLLTEILMDVRRVIYLDSDIIFQGDISELWQEFNDVKLLGLVSMPQNFQKNNHNRLGLDPGEKYFNSGVMLMNLESMRRNHSTERMLDFIHTTEIVLENVDQDVINLELRHEIYEIDPNWNFQIRNDITLSQEYLSKQINAKALHFLTAQKPWNSQYQVQYRDLYWKFRNTTPWGRSGLLKYFFDRK